MLTRVSTLAAAAVVLAVNSLACRGQVEPPRPVPTPAPTSDPRSRYLPIPSPEEIAHVKTLLFADTPLPEFLRDLKDKSGTQEEPTLSLVRAVEDMQRGRSAEAKRKLKQVLALPELETRVRLLIWGALRKLGERPPPETAGQVQGVICELHNEAGVGTLAVYADGGVRWLGGQGKVSFIDSPGTDPELDSLVRDLLKSAEPVVKLFQAGERRRPGEPPFEHFRVTVLTYGGIHVVELYGPGVAPGHFAVPILYASGALAEFIPEFEKKHPADLPPPEAERRTP